MQKKSVLWIVLDLVFLVVFNTVFFVAGGTSHPASVWISYGFIHFAYLMVLITPMLVRNSSSAAVFGFSLGVVSSVYFIVELIVGIVFILLAKDSYKGALIVQVILAGIYVSMLLINMIANETTADNLEVHEAEVAYIKNASARVKSLLGVAPDREIERVYDALHSSPSKSISQVHSLELDIMNLVSDLEAAVSAKNNDQIISLCGTLKRTIEERNQILRLNN